MKKSALPTNSVIDVTITDKEQLLSPYSYSDDKLNPDFCEYICDQAQELHAHGKIRINIHTKLNLDPNRLTKALQDRYHAANLAQGKESQRLLAVAGIMTLLGIIVLVGLVLIDTFAKNFYFSYIINIAAWVFLWEAVDVLFLRWPSVNLKWLLIKRLGAAEVQICHDVTK